MCVRMCPLSFEEAQDALEAREQTGRARVKRADEFDAWFPFERFTRGIAQKPY